MARSRFSLRKPESQATVALVLSLIGASMVIPLAYGALQDMNWGERVILYGNPQRVVFIVATTLVGIGAALVGFGMGFSSATNRRNTMPGRGWLAFFISAAALCLTIILFLWFWMWKERIA